MAQSHRFMIGDITCIALLEGTSEVDVSNLPNRFPNAAEDEIQDALEKVGFDGGKVLNYFNILYVESGGTKILFDAGMPASPDRPNIGQLKDSLALEGISPDEIDIVYITHFHGDHYLGLLTDSEATFPNARYLTRDEEWDFWLENDDEKMAERVAGLNSFIEPLRDKFSTVSAGDDIADGVSILAIPGHTMGQSAIKIESGDDMMIHMVDLLHGVIQFHYPKWQIAFDTDGDLAVQTRLAHLQDAVTNNTLLMFYHLPFPALGHVERDGDAFKWVPLES